jgi:hypothetical protein
MSAKKRRNKPDETIRVVAICSFSPEEFALLRLFADDVDSLHDTYDEWRADVDKHKKGISSPEIVVQEVEVTGLELQEWCSEMERPLNGAARAAFAAEKSKKMHS